MRSTWTAAGDPGGAGGARRAAALAAALLLMALCARTLASCGAPPMRSPQSPEVALEEPRELAVPTVRFVVRTPRVDGTLHLAGSFNGWDPAAPGWALERQVETLSGQVWALEVERARLGAAPVEFKFTRGSWATVEVDGGLEDVANHALTEAALADWPDEALLVLDYRVPAFADEREGGAPRAPRASTADGRVETFELASAVLGNTRTVRVWLPPDAADGARLPVLYLQDGQNVFDAATSFLGVEWRADETAGALVAAGRVAPLAIVAVDHAGLARGPEYNPPQVTFPGGPARGDRYVEFLATELLPAVEARFPVATAPAGRALGGSSYGANAALCAALLRPGLFGGLLLESPSVGHQRGVLLELARAHDAAWPERVWIGVGTAEVEDPARAAAFVDAARALAGILEADGLGEERLRLVVEDGARHAEAAWARRLPTALEFLFPPR